MPWARIDDKANSDAKLLALGDSAHRMWTCGKIYVANALTDGFIPAYAIEAFGVRAPNKQEVAEELCRVLVPGKGPLWHHASREIDGVKVDGYQIHDYHDYNDSAEEIRKNREAGKNRVRKFRAAKKSHSNGNGNALPNALQNALQAALPNVLPTRYSNAAPETIRDADTDQAEQHVTNQGSVVTAQVDKTQSLSVVTPSVTRDVTPCVTRDVTPCVTRVVRGTTYHVQEERTKEYSGEKHAAPSADVKANAKPKDKRPGASLWTRGLAIAHAVIEADPSNANGWLSEIKFRMQNQGMDAHADGPKATGPFYARVHDAALEQRKFRKGDGGVINHRWRRSARERDKRERRQA